tara:strand:- start:14187 stop:14441 length:255 start_codon:yes stop_codon:yes gene_type:complete
MEVKLLVNEKNSMDIEIDSLTIAEILRVYLNKEGAKLAAWRRDHPTKNPVLHIEGNNPKKLLKNAIAALEKDIDNEVSSFKKLK